MQILHRMTHPNEIKNKELIIVVRGPQRAESQIAEKSGLQKTGRKKVFFGIWPK
jgi:hypothetical protein